MTPVAVAPSRRIPPSFFAVTIIRVVFGVSASSSTSMSRSPAFATIDGALGAVLTACIGLLIAWVLGAVALRADPDIRYTL